MALLHENSVFSSSVSSAKGDNPSLAIVPITPIFAHSAIMYSVYKTQSCTSERGVNQTREPPARFLFLGISALN